MSVFRRSLTVKDLHGRFPCKSDHLSVRGAFVFDLVLPAFETLSPWWVRKALILFSPTARWLEGRT